MAGGVANQGERTFNPIALALAPAAIASSRHRTACTLLASAIARCKASPSQARSRRPAYPPRRPPTAWPTPRAAAPPGYCPTSIPLVRPVRCRCPHPSSRPDVCPCRYFVAGPAAKVWRAPATATDTILKDSETIQRFTNLGLEIQHKSTEEYNDSLGTEIDKWTKFMKDSGAKVD